LKNAHASFDSGSLHVYADYSPTNASGQNQIMVGRPFECGFWYLPLPPLDGTLYANVTVSILWDTNGSIGISDFNSDGEPGLAAGFLTVSNTLTGFTVVPVPNAASNGWVHLAWPINPTMPGLDQIKGVVFEKYNTDSMNGTVGFWIDDLTMQAPPCSSCIPPVVMAVQPARPGLNLFAASSGQYDRQNIRTAPGSGVYSWLGQGDNPVTYSFTVTDFAAATTNFQVHLFLIPNAGTESFPDWNEPAVICLALRNAGPGNHADWLFQYRTNFPPGNVQFTNPPVVITHPSLLGTWSLTFLNDTNVTMTAPGGATTNFNLPEAVPACFADPLYVYFGVQPNETANSGSSAVLSQVRIQDDIYGITHVQDDFSNGLDTNLWQVTAASVAAIQPVPANAYWLQWTFPDAGYVLQTNSNIGDASGWASNGLPAPARIGDAKYTLLTTNLAFTASPVAFPGPGSLFFRLKK